MIKKSGGRKTVPQIFINDMCVGGFDDLNTLNENGKLDELLFLNNQ
ncbi:glutaredoxin 3 [Neorickettsia risticii str. Illinois]|uniref:Glutaredoxin 3 n=2 Tax=Neorickettsia risticii TaxID=950 RepID=C6V4H4_NEORI|nr:glutaredoxin 3 [Neorickettsia risticii str. Illinois]